MGARKNRMKSSPKGSRNRYGVQARRWMVNLECTRGATREVVASAIAHSPLIGLYHYPIAGAVLSEITSPTTQATSGRSSVQEVTLNPCPCIKTMVLC